MQATKAYLAAFIGVFFVALVGSLLTAGGLGWYYDLSLPAVAPSGEFIGLAWTAIYIFDIFAIALFLKARRGEDFWLIVTLFFLNGLLNMLWSAIFFQWHLLWWALGEMLLLNLTTVGLFLLLWFYERRSAYLLVPYFVWVSFATYLTYIIALSNEVVL
jgi:tryptophan-rich sensory protein